MKKLKVLIIFVLLFGMLHYYTEWKFSNKNSKGVIEQMEEWSGKLGQTQITYNFKLIGGRLVGEDDYVGSYIADCDGETEKDVIFGGASTENRKLRVYGTIKTELNRSILCELIDTFSDGNEKTARLLMNLVLMRSGYPITVVTTEERDEYMKALEKASVDGNIDDFVKVVANAVNRSLDTYLYIWQVFVFVIAL